jgi:uncharacterized cupredoxin-like copper-binding protein
MVRLGVIALSYALATVPAHSANPWAHPKAVDVIMVDNRFQPDHLTFQAGKPYALHLVNRGKEMHEFTAPEFWKAAHVQNPGALANGGTDVVVQPGQSATIVLLAPPAGHYDLTCADHNWDGMVGQIDVR